MRLPDPLAAYRRWRERRPYDWWRRELYLLTGDAAFLAMTEAEIDTRLVSAMVVIKAARAAQAMFDLAEAESGLAHQPPRPRPR